MTPPQNMAPAIVLISFQLKPGCLEQYQRWQDQVRQVLIRYPGFLGHEVLPPRPGLQTDWVVIFRFRTLENLEQWLNSAQRQDLLQATTNLFIAPAKQRVLVTEERPGQVVSVIFTNHVKPGYGQAFQRWREKALAVQRRFPGFISFDCFPPHDETSYEWVDVVQFDSPDHLNAWLESPQRQHLLQQLEPLVDSSDMQPVMSSFAGWFPVHRNLPTPPPAWKQALAVVLCLYPTVMMVGWILGPYFPQARATSTLLINLITVALLNWVGMPVINRTLRGWLSPQRPSVQRDLAGALGVGLGIGLFWLIFSHL